MRTYCMLPKQDSVPRKEDSILVILRTIYRGMYPLTDKISLSEFNGLYWHGKHMFTLYTHTHTLFYKGIKQVLDQVLSVV
jgi:hypothetical protein